jgi:maltose alpha-D-glucosyltransferase/alpha-amylase
MVRSFHYASILPLLAGSLRAADKPIAEPWAHLWHTWIAAAFLRGYLATARGAVFLPKDDEQLSMLLDRFVLAKAFHELGAELDDPSERLSIPLYGIASMTGAIGAVKP